MWTSYAQNFEDVMLRRVFGDVVNGVYVDVGAYDPVYDSVSLAFYERGWRGIHVEPVPALADRLEQARPGERVIRAAVGANRGSLPFFLVEGTGLNTADEAIAARHAAAGFRVSSIEVPSLPLSEILDSIERDDVHWLKIDVEGTEHAVLESWGASLVRPFVVVVESTKPLSQEPSYQAWEAELLRRGYGFAYADGLNRFYARLDCPDLLAALATPPNVFDNFCLAETSSFARPLAARLAQDAAEIRNATEVIDHYKAHMQRLEADREALAKANQLLQSRYDRAGKKIVENVRELNSLRVQVQHIARHNQELEKITRQIFDSLSWKITAPLRQGNALASHLGSGLRAWLSFRPGSRPHRLVSSLLGNASFSAFPTGQPGRPTFYVMVGHTVDCSTNTGVQRVVRGLSRALIEAGCGVCFVRWDAVAERFLLIDAAQRARLSQWNGPSVAAPEASFYPAAGGTAAAVDPERGGWLLVPEVPFMGFGEQPVTARIVAAAHDAGLKTGFVFYDAIPLRRPEFAEAAPILAEYMADLREADSVWPISRWSADELISFWGAQDGTIPAPDIEPIHLPAEFDRPRVNAPTVGEKLILSVGTIEPRKNQTTLIRAFQNILEERPDSEWKLVLVGNLHPLVAPEVDAAARPGSAIEFRGHVSDAELSDLYDRCAFTVFPSLDEGYGLPILESLWQAKPCLCADFGAMAEVAEGGGCLTADVSDEETLQRALERLMDDDALRHELIRQAIVRPMPTWAGYVTAIERATQAGGGHIYYWVDATISTPVNTGIQRVVRQLARGLIDQGFALIPVKWGDVDHPLQPVTREELEHFALWNGPAADSWSDWIGPERQAGSWFVMGELPLQYTDAEQKSIRSAAERAGLKTSAIFYDTIPWKMRDIYPNHFSNAHLLYMDELSHYDRVLAISEYSRNEMATVLRDDLGRPGLFDNIVACPLPAEFPERSVELLPALGDASAGKRPITILSVGTVEPRKNHERLLDAFELACNRCSMPMRLVIAGGGHSIEPALAERVRRRVDENPRIAWEENVDDVRIRELYRGCDFTIYPSIEEGFGMPILESLWYGKPAICAEFGAMAEVAEGGGCIMVDVNDPEAMAAILCELATSPERRMCLAAEAEAREFTTWNDYARDVARKLDLWLKPDRETIGQRRAEMGLAPHPQPTSERLADAVASISI